MKFHHKRFTHFASILICVGFILLFCSNSSFSYDSWVYDSRSSLHIYIPDNATEWYCGDWVWNGITFFGISNRAHVTSVDVSFTINHTYLTDLLVDLVHPNYITEYRYVIYKYVKLRADTDLFQFVTLM